MTIVVSLLFGTMSWAQEPARVDRYGDPLPKGALVRLGTERFRHAHPLTAVFAAADNKIVALDHYGVVVAWDAQTGKKVYESKRLDQPHRGGIISPNGQYLAITEERKQDQDELEPALALVKVADATTVHRFSSDEKKADWFNSYVLLAFNPDGSLLASGHSKGAIRLWDVNTGKLVRKLEGPKHQVTALCFSPDGKTLASCFEDKTVRLWNVSDGKETLKFEHSPQGCAASLAFTPDGKRLISGGGIISTPRMSKGGVGGGDTTIRIWDVATGKALRTLPSPQPNTDKDYWFPPELTVHPQSRSLACLVGNIVVLWDMNTGQELWKHELGQSGRGLDFAADGKTLVVADGQTVHVLDTASGKALRSPHGSDNQVQRLYFSSDASSLISAHNYGEDYLWDVGKGAVREKLKTEYLPAIAPDRTMGASMNQQTIRLVRLPDGKELRKLEHNLAGFRSVLAFSADGKRLAFANEEGELRCWQVQDGKVLESKRLNFGKNRGFGGRTGAVFSPDLSVVAMAGDGFEDKALRLWDVATGKQLTALTTGDHFGFDEVVFAPDGKSIATRSFFNKWIRICDVATGAEIQRIERRELSGSGPICFSPDGKYIAAGGLEGYLFDVQTGELLFTFPAKPFHGDHLSAITFSADGTKIATGNSTGVILVWDMKAIRK